MTAVPRLSPPLEPGFRPSSLFNRVYEARVRQAADRAPLVLAVERDGGRISRLDVEIAGPADAETAHYAERLVKGLLWGWGGFRVYVGGRPEVGARIAATYAPGGARAFDADLMSRVYERPFQVVAGRPDEVPPARDAGVPLGGHLDGCRLGFDLGATDFKLAAVKDGVPVFTDEIPWNPKDQTDPDYHYSRLSEGLRRAAAHLPRVDAIGGSSAGVIVRNRLMVASLIRSVPAARLADAQGLFLRIARDWGVPLEVANDGDVTALAGAMALEVKGILGLAMGSSEAAGYLDTDGRLKGWLTELAFSPVDEAVDAPVDEWSGDSGVGASYFSQQAVNRLLGPAGIAVPSDMAVADRLKHVQSLMAQGDPRAVRLYETIGIYLGYALPHYRRFYDFGHILVLGRVTTGAGGDIVVRKAHEVLDTEFPDLAARVRLHVPDEKTRRVGQAVAAASLPALAASK